ncbi:MAG: GGDEF domain-containing protein [Sneathiella sp.]|nr:GGDEF domain-containing protein [Sneathiella sp.]
MSSSMATIPTVDTATPTGFEQDMALHLEDLTSKLKDSFRQQASAKHWQLINRVIAYAASAEQHISEQQARIRELEALSSTDELTGLHNRRGLQDFMTRTLSIARRHNETGILAFLDLDNFKEINDRYGHETGDRALKTLADTIASSLRRSDFIARVGGDEFVFVLTRTTEENGRSRALTMQRQISATMLPVRGKKLFLKASLGVASYNAESSFNQLMAAADQAMYENKKAQKARTI